VQTLVVEGQIQTKQVCQVVLRSRRFTAAYVSGAQTCMFRFPVALHVAVVLETSRNFAARLSTIHCNRKPAHATDTGSASYRPTMVVASAVCSRSIERRGLRSCALFKDCPVLVGCWSPAESAAPHVSSRRETKSGCGLILQGYNLISIEFHHGCFSSVGCTLARCRAPGTVETNQDTYSRASMLTVAAVVIT
jgi:hypothetical protein